MIRISRTLCFATCLTAGLALIPFAARADDRDEDRDRGRIAAYFTEWSIYGANFHVQDVYTKGSAAKLTHLLYAFGGVNASGQCYTVDTWADYESPLGFNLGGNAWGTVRGNFGQLQELKTLLPKLKVLISLGGANGSSNFPAAAATPASRQALVASCINLFIKGNIPADPIGGYPAVSIAGLFDGIDIDWEYPCGSNPAVPCPDTANYTALLQEFRKQLNALPKGSNYLLTADTPAGHYYYEAFDLAHLWHYVDFINLLTFDYHGDWESTTNFLAPLFNNSSDPAYSSNYLYNLTIDSTVHAYLAAGIPPDRLNMGLPFYGAGWNNVSAGPVPAQPGLYQSGAGVSTMPYNVLLPYVNAQGFTLHRDLVTGGAPWLYSPTPVNVVWPGVQTEASQFWTYDDPTSIAVKVLYGRFRGLGGSMIWESAATTQPERWSTRSTTDRARHIILAGPLARACGPVSATHSPRER